MEQSESNLWMRTVTSETLDKPGTQLATRSLIYKVDVVIDGVKTRALLDHGAQVSLAHRQLLPVIREKTAGQQNNVTQGI